MKILLLSSFVFIATLTATPIIFAWESHPIGKDANEDLLFGDEHVELTSRALIAVDAFAFLGSPSGPAIKTCRTVKDFNSPDLGWTTLTTRTYCPANFAELPDYSHSMEDYINQNRVCPPLSEWDPIECHDFSHFMGALNSSHFPPQTKTNYVQYHQIAQAVLTLGNDMHSKLFLADAESTYAAYVEECKMEALTYESIGQHYLQDQWAMGHMWHRWGGPEVDDFPLSSAFEPLASLPFPKIVYGTVIGAVSGMIHGWKGSARALWDSPFFTDDALSYFVSGVEWVRDDLTDPLTGIGDLFLDQLLDFDQQRIELDDCTQEGFRQVTGFDQNPTEISDLCWTNYATNWAMNIGLNLSPSTSASLIVSASAFADTGNIVSDVVIHSIGREMLRVSAIFALAALKDPWDTYIAEGYTTKARDERLVLFSIKPNDEYNRIPSYMDPAREAPGDPASTSAILPDNDLFGARQIKYFNQCHAQHYCDNSSIVNDYRDDCQTETNLNQEVDCQICEELATRYFVGEPALCEVLSPGVNPDSDNPNPPDSEEEVKTWCRQPDPVNSCDTPVEDQWGGIISVVQGTDKEPYLSQKTINCGDLTISLNQAGSTNCATDGFNPNSVCSIGTTLNGTSFSGCADTSVPSWTSDGFLNGANDLMAEYSSFSTFAEFSVSDRLLVTFRDVDEDGNTFVSGGSLGRCDATVAGSCWLGGPSAVCWEYGASVTGERANCLYVYEGTYMPTPCPTHNVVGRCMRGEGDAATSTLYYFTIDPTQICEDGTWIAE